MLCSERSSQTIEQSSGGVSSAGVNKFASLTEKVLSHQADEGTDGLKNSITVSQGWMNMAIYGKINEVDAEDDQAYKPVQGLMHSPRKPPRNGTSVKESPYINQKSAITEYIKRVEPMPVKYAENGEMYIIMLLPQFDKSLLCFSAND